MFRVLMPRGIGRRVLGRRLCCDSRMSVSHCRLRENRSVRLWRLRIAPMHPSRHIRRIRKCPRKRLPSWCRVGRGARCSRSAAGSPALRPARDDVTARSGCLRLQQLRARHPVEPGQLGGRLNLQGPVAALVGAQGLSLEVAVRQHLDGFEGSAAVPHGRGESARRAGAGTRQVPPDPRSRLCTWLQPLLGVAVLRPNTGPDVVVRRRAV